VDLVHLTLNDLHYYHYGPSGSPHYLSIYFTYKASLVAKDFQQVHGIDYDETFALVVKMDSIRLALSIVATKGWEVHQMDVKNAFLHGGLSKEIYME
jgi:hypothetical protein